ARLRLGEVLLEKVHPLGAREHFELLRKRRPEDPAVLLGLARCRSLLSDFDSARDLLDKLLKKHPRHAEALVQRGKLALEQGNPKEGEAYLRKAVAQDPASPEALYGLVLCLRQGGRK